jgi:4-amino-4-deoxy-L-arabinose transferase-like glycosyltransferase
VTGSASHPAWSSWSYGRLSCVFIGALTLLRLWFCTQIELSGDEAYYWLWSKHLDWAYFSKGPGVAAVIWLGTALAGDTVFGIRFFSVLLAAGTATLLYLLGRTFFNPRTGFWTVVLASLVPLFFVGGFVMTIDPISVFFWALAALLFWHALDSKNLLLWTATGLAVGLGALAKYTNLVLLLCFALFLAVHARHRFLLLRFRFHLLMVTALACLLPVLFWNARYDWITWTHLQHRGALDTAWTPKPGELLEFIALQFAVFHPVFMAGLIAVLFRVRSLRTPHPAAIPYLLCLFVPLMALYLALSLNKAGQANWTAPAYIAGLILLAAGACQWTQGHVRRRRAVTMVLAVSALLVAGAHLVPFLDVRSLAPSVFERDPLRRLRGAADLAEQTAALQQQHGATFLISNKYQLASLLSFYHPDRPQVFLPNHEGIQNQYSFWPSYDDGFWGATALFVSDSEEIPGQLVREFSSVELLKSTWSRHKGKPVNRYHIFLCRHFGGQEEDLDLPAAP